MSTQDKLLSPKIVFGFGARKRAGEYANSFSARKAMVVTDGGVSAAGWTKDVQRSLGEQGIEYVTYSSVTPNPRSTEVMDGSEIFRMQGCDIVVAIGGGSPMDCAKGIGVVATNKKDILHFEGADKISESRPPFIFIPTTAGTSSDISKACLITNLGEYRKIVILSETLIPDVSLIDPDVTATMDEYLTACTGMDAMVHAIEAFVSMDATRHTDVHALKAIEIINQDLVPLVKDIDNHELRKRLMLASMKAGLAFSNAMLGAVHSMAHSLGGLKDLAHGECNALLLDHVVNFNFPSAPERFRVIAETMNIDTRGMSNREVNRALMNRVWEIKSSVGINARLEQKGIRLTDVPLLADNAKKDMCLLTNPRKANKRDLEVIYEDAL
uniref:Alcohol dehydrogenase, class IV n=1 Tax=Candidatus Kentrum sp. TC TaxID=2126339 RepID=A0A450Z4U8_9GAMM|nr:MAG: Alcohol dehydrogenase, class IV [Candidatus Kentron sp. TC]